MSHNDAMLLQPSSQSDIDEIESLMSISVPPAPLQIPSSLPPPKPLSPPRASIPVTPSTISPLPPAPPSFPPHPQPTSSPLPNFASPSPTGFGGGPANSSLTEPVWITVKRDLLRILVNLRQVVFPNPYRADPGQALRDWDLWGPFFFIVFLGIAISSAASADNSRVFAVVFAVLAVGAVILTLNVLLLGGHIIFFQSLSLLGYCLFPLDVAALICMVGSHVIIKGIVVLITLAWSSWAAYPFVSTAVSPNRKALAVYPVLLLYVSIAFFIFAV